MTYRRSLKIIVSAGPTREPLDQVRFISNYSTGTQGYEIAKEARRRNHRVILISGPTSLKIPDKDIKYISVVTARDMKKAINEHFDWCDCLIMSAAVADYRPEKCLRGKLKKKKSSFLVRFVKNADILESLGRRKKGKILVGFSLDTTDVISYAKEKLKRKNLDLIVANKRTLNLEPFGDRKVSAYLINKHFKVEKLSNVGKDRLAELLLDSVEKL